VLTPSADASYTFKLTGSSFDTTLYVVNDCGMIDSSCLGADDQACTSCTESLTLNLTAGVPYYVIVDGSTNATNTTGSYTLDITSP
jgi:hypothetical protein